MGDVLGVFDRNMKKYNLIATLLLVLQACTGIHLSPEEMASDTIMMTVKAGVDTDTKSRYSPDENRIHDINLYVFDTQGNLVLSRYEEVRPDNITVQLKAGKNYIVRAVANLGMQKSFADESELLSWSLQWPDFQRNACMIMSGSTETLPEDNIVIVYLTLKRIASKVSFCIDDSALGSVEITSVKLCQAPLSTIPFASANKAASTSDVAGGDSASDADLAVLNNGGEVIFYLFENMQGTLLPGNTDPWAKVPGNISTAGSLCSYVEVEGHFDGVSSIFSGDVCYRFYLGSNNCSNFDVKRNTDYRISLIMSTDLDAVSWKITTDATVVEEGHGRGYIFAGRQNSLSSLYLGECFQYAVEVDEALDAYFAGDLRQAGLLVCDALGNECTELELGALYLQDGVWLSDARCTSCSVSPREIWLYDPLRSRKVQKLSSAVSIAMPHVVFSSSIASTPASIERLKVIINNASNGMFAYLTDENGKTLGGQWYDNTLVNMSISPSCGNTAYSDIGSSIKATLARQSKNASYYARVTVLLPYSGTPLTTGYKLCELCVNNNGNINLDASLNGSATLARVPVVLDYSVIRLNYDCGTQTASLANNSKLPLSISYYDFTGFGTSSYLYNGITDDTAEDFTYTYGGKTFKANRLDCPNYENQAFGYTKVGTKAVLSGKYDLSASLLDYYNAYALFNRDNCSSAEPYSRTYTVFDVALKGRSSTFALDSSHLTTTTGQTDPGTGSYGMHGGVVLFTKGKYLRATEGVEQLSGYPSVARAGTSIIYSPSLLQASLASPAALSSSQTSCTSGPNAGSTEALAMIVRGGYESVVTIYYSQLAALRTLPNGYNDSFFTTYSYYWKGYNLYSSSLSNPGNNTLSYTYKPGESMEMDISGTFGSDKFTSSNYKRSLSLRAGYTTTLKPGVSTQVIPVLNFINSKIYSMSETDSASERGNASTYQHRYHPADFYISGSIRTSAPDALYKCVIPKLFQGQMKYLNTNYEGFYFWIFRDVSAPLFSTELEKYNAASNCDKYTSWYYKNASSNSQSLTTGTCILFSK